jgi:hypothetical protein
VPSQGVNFLGSEGEYVQMSDNRMVGKIGRVSGAIAPGQVGEVILPVRGSSEAFLAYSEGNDLTIPRGTRVVVTEYIPPRTVMVVPE